MGRKQRRQQSQFKKTQNIGKHLISEYKEANKQLEKEAGKQADIVFGSALLVFWEKYGWRKRKCTKIMQETGRAWDEVGDAGCDLSMLELAEKETGIELSLDGEKSYHEVDFLDASKWNRNSNSIAKLILTRQQQKKWLATMMIANLCVALHRVEGFGFERLSKFVVEVNQFLQSRHDRQWYLDECDKRGIKWLILEGMKRQTPRKE